MRAASGAFNTTLGLFCHSIYLFQHARFPIRGWNNAFCLLLSVVCSVPNINRRRSAAHKSYGQVRACDELFRSPGGKVMRSVLEELWPADSEVRGRWILYTRSRVSLPEMESFSLRTAKTCGVSGSAGYAYDVHSKVDLIPSALSVSNLVVYNFPK